VPNFMDADLARSGLSPADLAASPKPNPFDPTGTSGAYTIPYWDLNGTMHPFMARTRLENKAGGRGKYDQPSKEDAARLGRDPHDVTLPYFNPFILHRIYQNTGMTWEQIGALTLPPGRGKLLCLVEGEKKAAATGLFCGRLAIGIGGCNNGIVRDKNGLYAPHPELLRVAKPRDHIEIVFDADLRTNSNVELAAGSTRRAFLRYGISVSFVMVPKDANGIDDWLVTIPLQERVRAFESLPRLTFDRGELMEDRDTLIAYLNLPTTDKGTLVCNESTARDVLNRHERYRGRVWVEDTSNLMMETVTEDKPRPITDAFIKKQTTWFQKKVNGSFSASKIENAIKTLPADDNRHRNETVEYIAALKWDGVPRLETMFIDHFAAEDTIYTRAIGKAWMLSVVARALRPGCESQNMLVLEGKQGIGKSRSMKALGGPWYIETTTAMDSKDFILEGHRSLIFDLAEMGSYKYSDFAFVKALLSTSMDVVRAPYGTVAEHRPRRFVCVGSTNEDLYLRDLTGNRRFWPIACGLNGKKIDVERLTAIRDQLFAEAKVMLDAGAQWWVDDDITRAAQEQRVARDPWQDSLESVLDAAKALPPAIHIGGVPHHFVAAQTLLHEMPTGGSKHSGHYQHLSMLMKKCHSEWEPYQYDNPLKPLSVVGTLKAKIRGYKMPVGNGQVLAAPTATATATTMPATEPDVESK